MNPQNDVYNPESFAARVNFAAKVIASGANTTRRFDTCFEMFDGDAVCVALYRRSLKNPKLAANLHRYISFEQWEIDKLKDVKTRDLAKAARAERAEHAARRAEHRYEAAL